MKSGANLSPFPLKPGFSPVMNAAVIKTVSTVLPRADQPLKRLFRIRPPGTRLKSGVNEKRQLRLSVQKTTEKFL